jgi:hypothetical protein
MRDEMVSEGNEQRHALVVLLCGSSRQVTQLAAQDGNVEAVRMTSSLRVLSPSHWIANGRGPSSVDGVEEPTTALKLDGDDLEPRLCQPLQVDEVHEMERDVVTG